MESLRELYRIGVGPSSSHTMGPRAAATAFFNDYCSDGVQYFAYLYGSLAATGKGHLTDVAIRDSFEAVGKDVSIFWKPNEFKTYHPNAVTFIGFDSQDKPIAEKTYYSVGGGKIVEEGKQEEVEAISVYPKDLNTMSKILKYCNNEGLQLWEFVLNSEGPEILEYMKIVWTAMTDAIERGIDAEGVLPGGLKLPRKAASYYEKSTQFGGDEGKSAESLSYALAVSEENAAGGIIVTAPTCGSCGVLPGVLYYLQKRNKFNERKILRALLTAGLIGNLVKMNGSISGAEVGCQGEIGVACAMASGAATQLLGGTIHQVEYAAEMGLEHHLGLTCDPMMGLVQIPCIERNAMATMRSIDHCTYALMSDGRHKVSFDAVIGVMMETGHDIPSLYRETSLGGLARIKETVE
jgi:L-serine dehydratase